jgi:hypothetical protein
MKTRKGDSQTKATSWKKEEKLKKHEEAIS